MQDNVVPPLPPDRLEAFVTDRRRREELEESQERLRKLLAGRALFHVSSRMRAGGLAELLRSQVAYARGVGVDAHWQVTEASPEFFALAKRIHNKLHGQSDAGPLDAESSSLYEQGLEKSGHELASRVKPGDLVVLHDPQTAGLVPAAKLAGAQVIWRCHVGLDAPSEVAREAWAFLQPYVAEADAYVFSRPQFVWENLDRNRSFVIPPVINPIAPKNQELSDSAVSGILATAGLQPDGPDATFMRLDGSPGRVDRRVEVAGGAELAPDAPVVAQVSAWNRLKDPAGVVRMFAEFVAPHSPAHLVVAGPAVQWIPDETEAEDVYRETVESVAELPVSIRDRVHVVAIPNDDPEEAAAIVNALQSRSTVAVQHSRGEGFGLAVMEAMWKRRPVVCSRVGGLQEQVVEGKTGFLIDPNDVEGGGKAIVALLRDAGMAASMGAAGHDRVAQKFLLPHDVPRWVEAIEYAYTRAREPQRA